MVEDLSGEQSRQVGEYLAKKLGWIEIPEGTLDYISGYRWIRPDGYKSVHDPFFALCLQIQNGIYCDQPTWQVVMSMLEILGVLSLDESVLIHNWLENKKKDNLEAEHWET